MHFPFLYLFRNKLNMNLKIAISSISELNITSNVKDPHLSSHINLFSSIVFLNDKHRGLREDAPWIKTANLIKSL